MKHKISLVPLGFQNLIFTKNAELQILFNYIFDKLFRRKKFIL